MSRRPAAGDSVGDGIIPGNNPLGRWVSGIEPTCHPPFAGGRSRMPAMHAMPSRTIAAVLLAAFAFAGAPTDRRPGDPAAVRAKLSGWKVTAPHDTVASRPAQVPTLKLTGTRHAVRGR